MVGHVAPEAFLGGPIAAVQEGDVILVDCDQRKLEMELSDEELADRLSKVKRPEPRYKTGVFAKYASSVSSAARGAVTVPKW
jgi:dihydroxy-acid dehydratase